ncbi:MAG: DUF2232 domain-containing protein [Gemmatimonadales bacterium]
MLVPSEPTKRGLGRLVAGGVLYAIVAPLGAVAVPLALQLGLGGVRSRREILWFGVAVAYGTWWLLQPGELPDQTLRAAALIATIMFGALAWRTNLTVIHRSLVSIGAAGAVLASSFLALGRTWAEVAWVVTHRVGFIARLAIGGLWSAPSGEPLPQATREVLRQMEGWIGSAATVFGDSYGAVIALQLLAGLALATAAYHAIAEHPHGYPLGRLRDFHFTEHIGWGTVASLVVVLWPQLAVAKVAAFNVLGVTIALYALRGVAVFTFFLGLVGGRGFIIVLVAVATLFMLPLVLAGAIIIGVLDTGLNLRKRMSAMQTRG